MSLNAGKILEINITFNRKERILEYVRKYLFQASSSEHPDARKSEKSLVIVTPNPEQIVLAESNQLFADILNRADIAIPDGVGIVLAERFLHGNSKSEIRNPKLQRIPGVEFMQDLVALAAEQHVPIGLIGGRAGVAVKALECLKVRHPGLEGWAEELGELSIGDLSNLSDLGDLKRISEKIHSTGTQIVFVGLGAPKQEYFIEKLSLALGTQHSALILMSVGGSFDIIAGRVQRAPLFIRSIGFEWFWRLFQEPWRFRRQLALVKFVWLVAKEKVAKK